MPLLLVLHDPAPEAEAAVSAAVWDLAESHLRPAPNALLVESGVSAAYLAGHLAAALRRAEAEDAAPLLVAECGPAAARGWTGEAAAWLAERLSEPGAEGDAEAA